MQAHQDAEKPVMSSNEVSGALDSTRMGAVRIPSCRMRPLPARFHTYGSGSVERF
mgnify:CR=1 FL=1